MDAVVCGIDPGLSVTGYAILALQAGQAQVVDAGVCRFDQSPPLADRLCAIHQDISEIFTEHRPAVVAIEQLYAHYKHPRTAILMGHARGVILLAAATAGMKVRHYPATQIKRFLTGNGRASKGQVQRAIQTTLGLSQLPEPHDVADALAIALCGAADLGKRAVSEVTV
jgi:crossover junction endodeoxyribonuclease RuvC